MHRAPLQGEPIKPPERIPKFQKTIKHITRNLIMLRAPVAGNMSRRSPTMTIVTLVIHSYAYLLSNATEVGPIMKTLRKLRS